MDDIDIRILSLLQEDCTLSVSEIAKHVSLSSNPCWRRIRRLEQAGVILRRVAILDAAKLGSATTIFVSVRVTEEWSVESESNCKKVASLLGVLEFHRIADGGYLIKAQVDGIASYDAFHRQLATCFPNSEINSQFSLETIKNTTEIPLYYRP
jgi:Lrp/AsnC family transcriptional regulator, cysteine-sensing transcriptional activator